MEHEDKIRERAYQLWQQEGCQAGRHEDHWRRAMQELTDRPASGEGAAPDASEEVRRDDSPSPGLRPRQAEAE
jgi:hypothetical protein